MTPDDVLQELLPLFKALADRNRLRIVGLLAQRPYAVEELASVLGVGPSTVSHHLAVLGKAGLVEGRVDGHYNVYSLEAASLEGVAKRLLQRENLKQLAGRHAEADFDRKVLATFLEPDGSIRAFPVQEKKFLVLLRYVLREFQQGVRYSEKRVNEILRRYNEDTARLRRSLVEHRFMDREGGGGKYWRIDADS